MLTGNCAARVSDHTGFHYSQCSRRGVTEQGGKIWCKQHTPSVVAARRAKSRDASAKRLEAESFPFRATDLLREIVKERRHPGRVKELLDRADALLNGGESC